MARFYDLIEFLTFLFPITQSAVNAKYNFRSRCLSFAPEAYVFNSSRHILEYITAGTNVQIPDNDPTCMRPNQSVAVDFCRVGLSIPTSSRSSISFELWLPEGWSGRFLATGNGGIDGCIKYEDLAYGAQYKFATVGTNNGHNGTTGIDFYKNPAVLTDYAWRSLHTSVDIGKRLVDLIYAKPHDKSYYIGCSLGGRQGVKAAEMFPDDFDGIVAGCPALDFNNLQSWRGHFFPITGPPNASTFIPAKAWKGFVHDEVLKQCDGIDGAIDGIIEDPNLCDFDPEKLLCTKDNTTNCLTAPQVNTVRQIFSPYYFSDGSLIYPAMQPGSEIMAVEKLYAGKPFSYSEAIYTPTYTTAHLTTHDASVAFALNPSNIRTWPSTLLPYQRTGGKLLLYHGGQDNQITSYNTERFYTHLSLGMNATSDDLDEFLRFFRVPGMFHCQQGPGAWVFGQGGNAAAEGVGFDAGRNVLAAVVKWVEEGQAPESIVGTKFVNDSVGMGVEYVHRHCKFPARSTYLGGDPRGIDSWKCV
ncbi:hypothetical protein ACLMJK_003718 [Lecanora helva]